MENKDKYLSVITNFGCHYKCPECIVKNNNLKIPKTTLNGLENLKQEIDRNNVNWVSFSGGGDPLHGYSTQNWKECWESIRLATNGIKTELHTSVFSHHIFSKSFIDEGEWFLKRFDRIVYHCHDSTDLGWLKRYRKNQIIRAVFVVDESYNIDYVKSITQLVKDLTNVDELSFRQYVNSNYETQYYLHDELKQGHKKDWYYIEQNDYNLYYCEGKVYTKYSDIGKKTE